jgi:hypothetical protein
MTRVSTEQIMSRAGEHADAQAIKARPEAEHLAPAADLARGDYVHPGIRLALAIWVAGFGMLALQVLVEGAISLVRSLLR